MSVGQDLRESSIPRFAPSAFMLCARVPAAPGGSKLVIVPSRARRKP